MIKPKGLSLKFCFPIFVKICFMLANISTFLLTVNDNDNDDRQAVLNLLVYILGILASYVTDYYATPNDSNKTKKDKETVIVITSISLIFVSLGSYFFINKYVSLILITVISICDLIYYNIYGYNKNQSKNKN